uniref:Uncharacterized protein n=1 Tax=Rhizophora mucronata TaxID=61149 RepID=A0A2P2NBN6_RHIMU
MMMLTTHGLRMFSINGKHFEVSQTRLITWCFPNTRLDRIFIVLCS